MRLRNGSKAILVVVLFLFCTFLLIFLMGYPELRAQSSGDQRSTGSATHPEQLTPPPVPAQPRQNPTKTPAPDVSNAIKVRVNLVLVRVVVRDGQGQAIGDLHREDFLLFDKKKQQDILTFAVETPATHALVPKTPEPAAGGPAPAPATAIPAMLPQRFAALLFDDLNLGITDLMHLKLAANKFLDALQPSDSVAIYTTSGQYQLDFTQDRAKIREGIARVSPHPIMDTVQHCPDMSYYQADRIENYDDRQALEVATYDLLTCKYAGDPRLTSVARQDAQSYARSILHQGEDSTLRAFHAIDRVIHRMSFLPGQRTIVLISPGFHVTTDTRQYGELIDRAVRANVVVNSIDARGLYAPNSGDDISRPRALPASVSGWADTMRSEAQSEQQSVLGDLAEGSGGTFFHDRNDLGEGMRRFAAGPAFSYVLGFSPRGLKYDGAYHELKVRLASKSNYSVQARKGYFAPLIGGNPEAEAWEEVQDAVYSQDEIDDLPVQLRTKYSKKPGGGADLSVVAVLDVKGLRFQKSEGRNKENLTVVAAVFDSNGNYVDGRQNVVEMNLRDATLERMQSTGYSVPADFDLHPGMYMIRLVVRDSQADQMAATNSAVVIPN
jgi:VWFA-related protein